MAVILQAELQQCFDEKTRLQKRETSLNFNTVHICNALIKHEIAHHCFLVTALKNETYLENHGY